MFYLMATIRTTQTDAKVVVIEDIPIDHLWWVSIQMSRITAPLRQL